MKPAQAELEAVIAEKLGAGTDVPHPALRTFLEHRGQWPESYLHFGVHFAELAELEGAVSRIRDEMASDPAFAARIQSLQVLKGAGRTTTPRSTSGWPSPRSSRTPTGSLTANMRCRSTYGPTCSARIGIGGSVVELDYVFTGPGRERNPFNSLAP
ncbi:hypothetical protein [Saccharopolyspora shandongensis]|uniref:hypothetical protein n=1 Tax=Saccharopolyspora shandongensis TaxID=418495 RepID=UPI0033D1FC43